ncbi:hypothetical protein O9929_15555 [Vibrio lentus]|nr:hypothetical protein [Vibrio lentus]
MKQANTATKDFPRPTNGKIMDALKVAADQIQIQNVPADKALKQAAKKAQRIRPSESFLICKVIETIFLYA